MPIPDYGPSQCPFRGGVVAEVKIDGEPWKKAELGGNNKSEFVWHFWHFDWSLVPGEHTITSRAIDPGGQCPARAG